MKQIAVVNASPLIVLARIGHIHLITDVSPNLVVPSGVVHELMQGSHSDPARQWIMRDGQRYIRQVKQTDELVAAWDLGLGESQVITYALAHAHTEALLDDAAARACAKALGVKVCGTLGLLLRAKRLGIVQDIKPILTEFARVGFYVGPDMLRSVLGLAREL